MIKKILIINILIILYFIDIEAMRVDSRAQCSGRNFSWTQPMNCWKKLSPLTIKEMRIYNKTWSFRDTLARNKENLADTFLDVCCDFSFKMVRDEGDVAYGRAASNPSIIFLRDLTAVNPFIRNNLQKYAVTNFLNDVGEPREFTYEMREQIQNQIRAIAEDSVGCKLLRITIAKILVGNLPKLIFIPLKKADEIGIGFGSVGWGGYGTYGEDGYKAAKGDGMYICSGIYGWQIESDRFMSKIRQASTPDQKISMMKNKIFDFQAYSRMKLPNYRYILFFPESFCKRPIVSAIKSVGNKFKFFYTQLPPDVTLFRTVVRSLHLGNSDGLRKSDSRTNIKARLNLGKKKFSEKLNKKFSNVLQIMAEADCVTEKLTPEMFKYMRKVGGIKSYASHIVETMTQSVRSKKVENLISSFFGSDEEYRVQYGLTADGFDSLNESSYLSHKYHWIRASNANQSEIFEDIRKAFFQEHGDFDLYAYFLSPNSSIKYPKFGVSQYQCADNPHLETKETKNPYCGENERSPTRENQRGSVKTKGRRVRFLSPQADGKREGGCKI